MSLQQTAIHEAAHAIVARHYGLVVTEIRISGTTGKTFVLGDKTTRQAAAILAAGDVGQRFDGAYVYRSCTDMARFEAEHGFGQLWRAQRDAEEILTARRAALLALAARLQRERVLVLA